MPTDQERWKYAWDYFALHAQQRLTTFNFFLVFSTLLTGGLLTTFQREFRVPMLGVVAGILLALLAFVFWRLDRRNRQLIKNAEDGLRHLERAWNPGTEPPPFAVFLRDASYVERARKRGWGVNGHWSYSDCFNVAYLAMGLIGLGGASAAAWLLIGPA